jgi:hypothetical protein
MSYAYLRRLKRQKSMTVIAIVFALIPQPLLPILGEGEKAFEMLEEF